MKTGAKFLLLFNLAVTIMIVVPVKQLDLHYENYSTLSLDTKGYFYLLFLGVICGLLLGYETLLISGRRNAAMMFLSLIMGTIIPHHVPYNLQGNLHLLFAYSGFFMMCVLSIINLYRCGSNHLQSFYFLSLICSLSLYIKYGMVNTVSELIIIFSTLAVNLLMVIRHSSPLE